MISKKITELINKEIDGVISPLEKMKLEQQLRSDPETLKLYNELTQTVNSLNSLPDSEPQAELKKNILNSIDFNHYSKAGRRSFKEVIASLTPSPRLALTFAFGIVAGLIIISLVFPAANFFSVFQSDEVSGTIGLSGSRVIADIPVNTSGIKGKINILGGYDQSGEHPGQNMNHLQLNINLSSNDKIALRFRFNSREGVIEDFSCSGPAVFSLDEGTLNISTKDSHKSTFIVSFKRNIPDHLELSLLREGQELYTRSIQIRK